jgi:hypothetical protein
MIDAHPMVKGSFASNPNSVRVKQVQNHHNAGFAASEAVMDRRDAILGSQALAIAIRRLFIKQGIGCQDNHYACIGFHRENIIKIEPEWKE